MQMPKLEKRQYFRIQNPGELRKMPTIRQS